MLENAGKYQRFLLSIPYEDEKVPKECRIIPMQNEWVPSALKEEIKQWCPTQPIMISAPTGRGKTSFVADITKYWRKVRLNQKVLLLVNRTAIATQQKRELTKKLGSSWGKVSDVQGLELTDDFPDVGLTVKTYQAFAAQHQKMNLMEYGWVICDEAHYFLADSTFNPYLDQIFWKLPKLFPHAYRVYMTATPGAVLPVICEAEGENLKMCRICGRCLSDSCGRLKIYDFPSQFDQIRLFYFREVEEIVSLVQKYPNDKFLIFTSKREGDVSSVDRAYTKALREGGVTVDYLDRFSKDSDVWRKVCERGTFEAQVLVCTSVLDCGVSLHDDKIRHIIVETTDKTEFQQMIGRKRLKADEKLNVYVRVIDRGKLYARLRRIKDQLNFIYDAERKIKMGKGDELIFRAWSDEGGERLYAHLLNYCGASRVSKKETAYQYLRWQKGTLERLLRDAEEFGDDSALPRLACEWLDQEGGYDKTHWLDYDKKATAQIEILTFLGGFEGKKLNREEWKEFTSKFTELSAVIMTFPHDSTRKSQLKHQAINKRFKSLNLPYIVKSNNNTYEIIRKMEDVNEN